MSKSAPVRILCAWKSNRAPNMKLAQAHRVSRHLTTKPLYTQIVGIKTCHMHISSSRHAGERKLCSQHEISICNGRMHVIEQRPLLFTQSQEPKLITCARLLQNHTGQPKCSAEKAHRHTVGEFLSSGTTPPQQSFIDRDDPSRKREL